VVTAGGKQRLKRRVASAAFYNEKPNVNSVFIQRYLIDLRESGELRGCIGVIIVVEMGNSTTTVITWQVIAAPRAARHTGSIVNHRRRSS
jgi:AMMECR1 domain-containing protein